MSNYSPDGDLNWSATAGVAAVILGNSSVITQISHIANSRPAAPGRVARIDQHSFCGGQLRTTRRTTQLHQSRTAGFYDH